MLLKITDDSIQDLFLTTLNVAVHDIWAHKQRGLYWIVFDYVDSPLQTKAAADKLVVGPLADPAWSTSSELSPPRIEVLPLIEARPFNKPRPEHCEI